MDDDSIYILDEDNLNEVGHFKDNTNKIKNILDKNLFKSKDHSDYDTNNCIELKGNKNRTFINIFENSEAIYINDDDSVYTGKPKINNQYDDSKYLDSKNIKTLPNKKQSFKKKKIKKPTISKTKTLNSHINNSAGTFQ